ncbi:MAG: 2-oxo acid dehydrogenase subunit E2, partial [Chlamydiales bacterium]|nr:2-oxo acid dehydrogenase subunit E2 [Chlamydiales bacterium]
MSEEVKIVLPKLGESILSASVVRWFKKIGDPIQLDEPLLEVSTDKVNSEIPSPVSGILSQIHAEPDQEMQVGDLIAVVVLSSSHAPRTPFQEAPSLATPALAVETKGENSDLFSPAILWFDRVNGIPFSELEKLQGTGSSGRITKKDLEEYIAKKKSPSSCTPCSFKKEETASSCTDVEKVKMSGMRKAIADNMVRSFYEAPHATLVTEVDVSKILKYIQEEKQEFLDRHGFKLTITSFIAKALSDSLQEFPLINSSLEKDT